MNDWQIRIINLT